MGLEFSWSLLAAFCVGACATAFGFDDLTDRTPDGGAVFDGAASIPEAAAPLPCTPMGEPPSVRLGLGGERLDFALDMVDALTAGPGFDIDCKHTTDVASSSCRPDPRAKQSQIEDGDGGIDTAANLLFRSASAYLGSGLLVGATTARRMRAGWHSLLFVVGEVASFENDDDVFVFAFPAAGLVADGCVAQRGALGDGGLDASAGDAGDAGGAGRGFEDQWCLDEQFVVDGFGSTLPADRAWIREGRLHAHFPRLELPIADDSTRIAYVQLDDVYLTGKLERQGEHFVVTEGNLGGGWKTDDFIRVVGEAEKNSSCDSTPGFAQIADSQVCPFRDLRASAPKAGESSCDALSVALGFTGYQVKSQAAHPTKPVLVTEKCPGTPPQTFRCPGNE